MDRATFEGLSPRDQVETVLRVMGEVVAEFGDDYSIRQCQYVCDRTRPDLPVRDRMHAEGMVSRENLTVACLIGQVLARLGWTMEQMLTQNAAGILTTAFSTRMHYLARDVLSVAQYSQDGWKAAMTQSQGEIHFLPDESFGPVADVRWGVALRRAQTFAGTIDWSSVQ